MTKMNMTIKEKNENRREFLKNGIRTLVLGGIITVSGILGWRKTKSPENENICTIELPCRSCSVFDNCIDQKAVELKQDPFSK
ncbi:MAG: hypothetical protein GY863_08190 [bacterium]|nr:hypothetical protein [bacterium]